MRPPPRGGRNGQSAETGQRGHGDRRLAAAGRVLADHADQPLAGQHRRPEMPDHCDSPSASCRGGSARGHWSPAATTTRHQILGRQDHPPHLRSLPHHPRARGISWNSGYPTAQQLSTGTAPARPGPPRHRRGWQLSELVAELQQRQIHRVRITDQPVSDPRLMGHLVVPRTVIPAAVAPATTCAASAPAARPAEIRTVPVPLSRPGSEAASISELPAPAAAPPATPPPASGRA